MEWIYRELESHWKIAVLCHKFFLSIRHITVINIYDSRPTILTSLFSIFLIGSS